jgi:anti-sigma B factor antagonist
MGDDMPFAFERTTLDSGIVVLALSGTMTMGNQLLQLEWAVQELTSNQPSSRIAMDMSQVTYVDSSAIGVLMGCNGLAKNSGGQMRVSGVNDRILTIFRITQIDEVLRVDPNREASISALEAKA